MQSEIPIHDLIGIGFGPSNIALAIALEEKRQAGQDIEAIFIEKQPNFSWHKDMLLDQTHMQISFMKDLATMRNPTSQFTFINYLYEKNRLQDFINLQTFLPSRHEFSDYLSWAAEQFNNICKYGEEVLEILPEKEGNQIKFLRVRSQNTSGQVNEQLTRNLVISIGGIANIPKAFHSLRNDPRVFHSSSYLKNVSKHKEAKKIAVIGAGQSASEIFMNLHDLPTSPKIDLIMRARTIKPSDDSPFVNEIFNTDFTDHVFTREKFERCDLLREFKHTNYAAPDLEIIEQIYKIFYLLKVRNIERHHFLPRHSIQHVQSKDQGILLSLQDMNTGHSYTKHYDIVILATGYTRDYHKTLLTPLAKYLDDFTVDRNYRLLSNDDSFEPAIFLQGACEDSHGLSDTLLSVTAVRTDEIAEALISTCKKLKPTALSNISVRQDGISIL